MKTELINNLDKQQEVIDRLKNFVEELPDAIFEIEEIKISTNISGTSSWVTVRIPYNWVIYSQFRSALGKGWQKSRWQDSENGEMKIKSLFRDGSKSHLSPHLHIAMTPEMNGATCKRIQTGTKEVPQYQIVCA